jgi:mannose-6-phosphate isomerase-like protein (cupin superfamily)
VDTLGVSKRLRIVQIQQGDTMNINRFDKAKADAGHGGTVAGHGIISGDLAVPFQHWFTYLEKDGVMEGHSHPTDEIYVVVEGNGIVHVGDEKNNVTAGDVVEIPANVWHTMENQSGKPLQWIALWWEVVEK